MASLAFLDRSHSIAGEGYNRWLVPPAALAVHLSIGQVYAFSVFRTPLVDRFGTGEFPIAVIFSIAIVLLGLSAAFGGTWMERNGPRKAMFLAACCFSSGFLVGALGISTGQLWLVYLGYGVLGGIGLGMGYISPVSTLIKWFPDRPGLATGLAIMGFGGGALIASPLSNRLLGVFGGTDLAAGLVPTWIILGVGYFAFMMFGVFTVRLPPPDWRPAGYDPAARKQRSMQTASHVSAAGALRTPQFWLLWIVLFTNVTAGIGILEQASPMVQDFFPGVTPATAAGFVGLLSIGNMAGRVCWSSTSDYLGRKPTYMLYLGGGAVLFFLVTTAGSAALPFFVVLTFLIISFYGGGFATVPAYLKDLFGTYQVGAIHGRLLTAWSAAGVAGPTIVTLLTESQRRAGLEGPSAYRLSLLVMVGLLAVGFTANFLIRPVDVRHHVQAETVPAAYPEEGGGREETAGRTAQPAPGLGAPGSVHHAETNTAERSRR